MVKLESIIKLEPNVKLKTDIKVKPGFNPLLAHLSAPNLAEAYNNFRIKAEGICLARTYNNFNPNMLRFSFSICFIIVILIIIN